MIRKTSRVVFMIDDLFATEIFKKKMLSSFV